MATTAHNIDRFISDLRLILSQGRKRIGLLIGAGAPVSVKVDTDGHISESGKPLIPAIAGLTNQILKTISGPDMIAVGVLAKELGGSPNVEQILSRIRLLGRALGEGSLNGLNGSQYVALGDSICSNIGKIVSATLPKEPNPYTSITGWISGTVRPWPIEIFTTNYDLLFEEAFERARVPYFDGFSGGHEPFFDPSTVAADDLPSRWARLWKLHGSLGWGITGGRVVRGSGKDATGLIYPDHLKYDEVQKMPYSALFERLRRFLLTPDSLLITCGFSFGDAHVSAVLDEALAANANTAVFAFQYRPLADEHAACALAGVRANMSVYAADGAVIRGVSGQWQLGELPNREWADIRKTFWGARDSAGPQLLTLGDFTAFSQFIALSQAGQIQFAAESASVRDESEKVISK